MLKVRTVCLQNPLSLYLMYGRQGNLLRNTYDSHKPCSRVLVNGSDFGVSNRDLLAGVTSLGFLLSGIVTACLDIGPDLFAIDIDDVGLHVLGRLRVGEWVGATP